MADAIEAIGEAVSGGLAARAVELQAREHHGHGSHCLDCNTLLVADYC